MQPDSLSSLRSRISEERKLLPRRLGEVADYINANPQSVALDTLAQIATKAGVHASTLVRFANHFGFNGFSELQQLYKDHFHRNYSDYGERIRLLQQITGDQPPDPLQLLDQFAEANIASIQMLRDQLEPAALDTAVTMLSEAAVIHICAIRRAFPVAMYARYALGQMHIRCQVVDGIGLMHTEQAGNIEHRDVLLAMTFSPYALATRQVIEQANKIGARVLLITDSMDCTSVCFADHVIVVQDAQVQSFRSLNATLCLVQTLCIALGYRLKPTDSSS